MKHKYRMLMLNIFSLGFILFFNTGCHENKKPPAVKPIKKDTVKAIVIEKKVDSLPIMKSDSISFDSTKKYIYLTFDDGPQSGTTACMDICRKLNTKATFFMVGGHASSPNLQSIVKDIRNAYPFFLLANHSYTHANGKYKYFYHHERMAEQDFYKAQASLNVPFKIIRLPGNSAWVRKGEMKAHSMIKPVCVLLDSAGYNVIGWDQEWNFNHKTANPVQSPQTMVNQIDSALSKKHTLMKNHIVLLMHDRMFRNQNYADSLTRMIGLLKQHSNYVFETIDHYPGLKH